MSELVVSCRGLRFAYEPGKPILHGVSFGVRPGEFVGLVGPNGCGKSTVMRVLLGLLEPSGGEVRVLGRRPRAAVGTGEVGYVPQRESFHRNFPLSVLDVVLMGRAGRIGLGRRPGRADRAAALAALERLEIADWRRRAFGALSGGQQRLVLTARALAQEPKLLLMDEADTGLDEQRRRKVYATLDTLRSEGGLTILAISHQLDLLATVVDNAMALRDGRSLGWCPDCMHHAIGEARPHSALGAFS